MKHVALVGMMGVGKSTVGRYLAHCLGRDLFDTDYMIEAREGIPVTEIFAAKGEDYFRQIEREVVRRAIDEAPSVISLGGGAFVQPEIREMLRNECVTFYLRASLQSLLRRVGTGASRPLLHGGDLYEKLAQRLADRDPIYRLADVVVSTDRHSSAQVGERVIEYRSLFD
jgi:shikimate kinase